MEKLWIASVKLDTTTLKSTTDTDLAVVQSIAADEQTVFVITYVQNE